MYSFTQSELASMRNTQDNHMMDQCVIMVCHAGSDTYNNSKPSYVDGQPQACGIRNAKSGEGMNKSQVPLFDYVMRLPVHTVVSHLDRVRITRRYGETITGIVCEIVGMPLQGPSGLVLQLRRVTDGS